MRYNSIIWIGKIWPCYATPGTFSIYVGVGKDNGQTLEWLERVLDFKVLRIGVKPEFNYRWNNVHGFVNDNSKWEIKESN